MNKIGKIIMTVVLILACMAYTAFNYIQGRIDQNFLLVSLMILGFPLVNIVKALVKQLRDKD